MSKIFPFTIVILFWLMCGVGGDNILFFFGFGTYSHRISVWPLVETLTERGHNVTFIQRFRPKVTHPNVHEFLPLGLEAVAKEFAHVDFLDTRLNGGHSATIRFATQMPQKAIRICEAFLEDEETQGWIKSSNYSLVIIDALMNECGVALAYKFQAKVIQYATTHMFGWWFDEFGFPAETSTIPNHHFPFRYPMTFPERLLSTLIELGLYLHKKYVFYPALDKVVREGLRDPQMPYIESLTKETSLLFANTHFSEEYARSVPPLVIFIGGMHCNDNAQNLTKDLEDFLENRDGFVYISFGSTAKICNTSFQFQSIFYEALTQSPETNFVWKYECDRPPEMPSNVFTANWMPQQAILAHPKIQAFFTHGGLLGIQEAVWHGVPLVVMPIFADQDYNSYRIERTEIGIVVDPNKLTVAGLRNSIRKVINTSKYKKNMEITSKLFRDRPLHPVEEALWWTEFVLRNDKEAVHSALKPLGINQTWYERRLLDVWAFIFIFILIAIILALSLTKIIIVYFLRFFYIVNSDILQNSALENKKKLKGE